MKDSSIKVLFDTQPLDPSEGNRLVTFRKQALRDQQLLLVRFHRKAIIAEKIPGDRKEEKQNQQPE